MLDAGKFYEQFSVSGASRDMRKCLGRATRISKCETATVIRGRRVSGHLGGRVPPHLPLASHVNVYSFKEMLAMFTACLRIVYVAIGDTVYRVTHVPIEG